LRLVSGNPWLTPLVYGGGLASFYYCLFIRVRLATGPAFSLAAHRKRQVESR
jgi:hypothetical protein